VSPGENPAGTPDLKGYIREQAGQLGFDLVGFARAERPDPEASRFGGWLEAGFHGSMKWIERNAARRMDPDAVLPGAKTIVSLATNYYTPHVHEARQGTGKISRYAWGDDYHERMERSLKELLKRIREVDPSVAGKVYVDTGPVLEKAWAQRAGLGWLGKHTAIISREYGSWIFLAEVILTADLAPDAPETDQCGDCTLCIEACPTGAIVEPYLLDARRCISYLTIEQKDDIGDEFSGNLDGWLYGCDVCQDVCPWNDRPVESRVEGFEPREGNVDREISGILEMDRAEFSSQFKKSPVKRTGYAGIRRNARALSGLTGDKHNNGNGNGQ
jgi:epoxyqueuosine reductase